MRAFAIAALVLAACGGTPLQATPPHDGGVLAPAGDTAQGQTVDGISCDTSEQLLFHIHAHLGIYEQGKQLLIPAGIGIGPPLQILNGFVVGGSCFSWIHTHDESGIIHIESPVQRTFTLGDLFDIWGQPLSAAQVGPVHGGVVGFVGDMSFKGDVRTIPLTDHAVIQLDVGQPALVPQPYTWPPNY
jgi:hypothetical protein